ncbi:unnamed protein product [Cylindrotheca closterium]|uniref:Uncharacterized protein n=1 Tax=Cylindrotheca closterium TaxID=2856 RepID=A0AAD2FG92_9STRA|nr:unnamed protein product [Cylindrotheca closterium]
MARVRDCPLAASLRFFSLWCIPLLFLFLCQPLTASTLPSKRHRSLPEDEIYNNEFPGTERSKRIKKQQLANLLPSNVEPTLLERRLDNKANRKGYSDVTGRRMQRSKPTTIDDRILSSKKSSKRSSSSSEYYTYYSTDYYSSKGKGGNGKASSVYSSGKGGMFPPVLYVPIPVPTTSSSTSTSSAEEEDDNIESSTDENSDDEDNDEEDEDEGDDGHDDETLNLFDFLEYQEFKPAAPPTLSPTASPPTSNAPSFNPSQFPSTAPTNSITPSKSIAPSERPSQDPSVSFQPSQSQNPSRLPSGSFQPSESAFPSSGPSASQSPSESSAPPSESIQPSTVPSSAPTIEPIVFGTATIKIKSQLFDTDSGNAGDKMGDDMQNPQEIFFIGDQG